MDSRNKTKRECFDKKYANKYLNLVQLVTRPFFARQGAATKLLQWGMELARNNEWAIALFAGPVGLPLYRKLGFQEVGVLHVEGTLDSPALNYPAMIWKAPTL